VASSYGAVPSNEGRGYVIRRLIRRAILHGQKLGLKEAFNNLADDDPENYPGGENERYLEVWNIVFSQFNHTPEGTYEPLPRKNIDTGMGLERVVSVFQNAKTNFETDLFLPIIHKTEELSDGKHYGDNAQDDVSFKVIADHARAITFAISDGALPSNEGRGYVIRRLIRRAILHGQKLGLKEAFNNLADDDPENYPGGENERYLEVWNIVFSQFNHTPEGTYEPLPRKNIDTGMGLERVVSVFQNAKTNFETDLFLPIIHKTEELSDGKHYGDNAQDDVSFKVIADHARAITFAISDGALPSVVSVFQNAKTNFETDL
ncbi:hypothetical protein WP50_00695, partial [Lactiplantibacillus plantarum]